MKFDCIAGFEQQIPGHCLGCLWAKIIWILTMWIGRLCLDLTALTFWAVCVTKLTREAVFSILRKWHAITLDMHSDCNVIRAGFLTLLFFHLFFFGEERLKIGCLLGTENQRPGRSYMVINFLSRVLPQGTVCRWCLVPVLCFKSTWVNNLYRQYFKNSLKFNTLQTTCHMMIFSQAELY